ncbi:Uncharacterised protein [Mycobacteroides abscessus subsp. bolletii]|nr:Uncharacterised protein [Mycobacteroides abscessus subsp. bolletii]
MTSLVARLALFPDFLLTVRKLIYTTNRIDSLNARFGE